MKNKEWFLRILIIVISVIIISIIVLALLGKKERVGYLSDLNLNIDNTLEINGLDIYQIKKLFTIDDKLDEAAITNYIFTNDSITNYNYGFKIKYYSKVFKNSDIYGVYPNIGNILSNNTFIREIKIGEKGSPFGYFISTKIINFDNIDNINYILKLKIDVLIRIIFVISIIIYGFYLLIELFMEYDIFNDVKCFIFSKHDFSVINNSYITAYILFFPFVILLYQSMNASFPYYYAWDSSKWYSYDILLISSNKMASHYFHPNMIPLLIYTYIFIPIGKLLGIISITNITEIENSLNPYLSYVEFVEYLLNINRIMFLLFLTFMYINILKIINIHKIVYNRLLLLLFSLLLIISSSIFSNTAFINNVIRYELIGLLLSSISLYFIILSSEKTIFGKKKHKIYFIFSAILSGSAILSKVSLVFFVFIIFYVYIILNIEKYFESNNRKFNFKLIYKAFIFYIILFMFPTIIISLGYHTDTFGGILNYNKLLIIQLIFLLFLVSLSIISFLFSKGKIYFINSIQFIIYDIFIYFIFTLFPIVFAFLLPKGIDTFILTYLNSYSGNNTILYFNKEKWIPILILFYFIFIVSFIIISFISKKKTIIQYKIQSFIIKRFLLIKNILSTALFLFSFLIFNKLLRQDEKDILILYSILLVSFFIFYKHLLCIKRYRFISIFILLIIIMFHSFNSIDNFIKYNDLLIGNHEVNRGSSFIFTLPEWKMVYNKYTDQSWDSIFFWSRNVKQVRRLLKQIQITDNSLNDSIIADICSKIDNSNINVISNIDNNLSGGIILKLMDDTNNVFLRADYDFYFISDIEYKKEDERIIFTDYDFYINNDKYYVYKLNMNKWYELNYGYNGEFNFKKGEDFNRGFILISDRLAKGL